MCRRPSSKLLEVLLTTIEQLEKDADFGPGDPTVTELKRIVVLRLAELEGAPMDIGSQVGEIRCVRKTSRVRPPHHTKNALNALISPVAISRVVWPFVGQTKNLMPGFGSDIPLQERYIVYVAYEWI